MTFSFAWMHGFRNAISGPILQIPGSSVRLDAQLDTLWAGVNVKFGGPKRKGPAASTYSSMSEMTPQVIDRRPVHSATADSGRPRERELFIERQLRPAAIAGSHRTPERDLLDGSGRRRDDTARVEWTAYRTAVPLSTIPDSRHSPTRPKACDAPSGECRMKKHSRPEGDAQQP